MRTYYFSPWNSQGMIDFKPYDETAASMFKVEDTDGDGVLTINETVTSFVKFDFNSK